MALTKPQPEILEAFDGRYLSSYKKPIHNISSHKVNWRLVTPRDSKTSTYYNSADNKEIVFQFHRNPNELTCPGKAEINISAFWIDGVSAPLTAANNHLPLLGVWQMRYARLEINDRLVEEIPEQADHVLFTNILSMMSRDQMFASDDILLLSGKQYNPFGFAVATSTSASSDESVNLVTNGKLASHTVAYTQRLPLKYLFRSLSNENIYNNIDKMTVTLRFPIESYDGWFRQSSGGAVIPHVGINEANMWVPTYEKTGKQAEKNSEYVAQGQTEYMNFIERRCSSESFTSGATFRRASIANLERAWLAFSAYDVAATNSKTHEYLRNGITSIEAKYSNFSLPESGSLTLYSATDQNINELRMLWIESVYPEETAMIPFSSYEMQNTMFLMRFATKTISENNLIQANMPSDFSFRLNGAATHNILIFLDTRKIVAIRADGSVESLMS